MSDNEQQNSGHGGARSGAGRPKTAEVLPNSNDIKRVFFSGAVLQELLNTMMKMSRNRPVKRIVLDKQGVPHTIMSAPYSDKVQQAATADLLDRGFGRALQAIDMQADVTAGIPVIINFGRAHTDNDASDNSESD